MRGTRGRRPTASRPSRVDHAGRTYDLTGPRLLSFADATAELAAAAGRPLHYVPVSFAAYVELLAPYMPPAEAAFLVELFRGLLDGHNAHVGDGVMRALGRPPRDFRAFARAAFGAGDPGQRGSNA